MTIQKTARFSLGQVVQGRSQPLQGVVLDVDAMCAVPLDGEVDADQPFYQVFAFGEDGGFIAYVPEEALIAVDDGPVLSPREEAHWFTVDALGRHAPRSQPIH